MPKGDTLTPKQQRFADEYLIDLNATAAYKRSGYIGKGNTAEVCASQLLSNPKVAAYLTKRRVIMEDKTHITQERVLAEYAKLAFLDPRKFFDVNGDLLPVHDLDDDTAAALAGMDVLVSKSEDGGLEYTKKIKISDKKGALDSIARHLGMFVEKVEMTGNVTVQVIDYSALHKPKV